MNLQLNKSSRLQAVWPCDQAGSHTGKKGTTMTTGLGLALPVQKACSIGRDVPAVANAAEEIGA
jgi:hypothetical protein